MSCFSAGYIRTTDETESMDRIDHAHCAHAKLARDLISIIGLRVHHDPVLRGMYGRCCERERERERAREPGKLVAMIYIGC